MQIGLLLFPLLLPLLQAPAAGTGVFYLPLFVWMAHSPRKGKATKTEDPISVEGPYCWFG
jgi:hypothetical protein